MKSFLALLILIPNFSYASPVQTGACEKVAVSSAVAANNEEPDPEITPPARTAIDLKAIKANEDYVVTLDNGLQYEVQTKLEINGTCTSTQIDNL